jgi:uncharacterized membrane protein (UPF0127 family)
MEIIDTIRFNLKKVIIGLIVVFGVLIVVLFLASQIKSPKIKVNGKTFSLYVAKTDKDRQVGLSKYKTLSDGKGMIFLFDKEDYYPFWMKGMKFPIDIIYIKGDKVVTVFKDLKAENSDSVIFYPSSPADKVLEVNAGLSAKNGIEAGDKVELKNL